MVPDFSKDADSTQSPAGTGLPDSTVAEVLGERGWNTYMVGKWHLCPEEQENLASVALIETAFP